MKPVRGPGHGDGLNIVGGGLGLLEGADGFLRPVDVFARLEVAVKFLET